MTIARFRKIVWDHYRKNGRDLPWRKTVDPYRILVSEVMLQQTQVSRVLKFYAPFIRAFPNVRVLARAPLKEVLRLWQGLGYNRRALYLKRIAAAVVERHHGRLPRAIEDLERLPGIGRATASAILAFAWNKPVAFLETNIRSVLLHCFFHEKKKVADEKLLPFLRRALDCRSSREWYWALMDYGSHLKTCHQNPGRASAAYRRQVPFRGSLRELRGKIVRVLLKGGAPSLGALAAAAGAPAARVREAIAALRREGIVSRRG